LASDASGEMVSSKRPKFPCPAWFLLSPLRTKIPTHLQVDKISENELQIFPSDKSAFSLLSFLDSTETYGGQEQLRKLLSRPLSDAAQIAERQELLRFLMIHSEKWQLPATGKEVFTLERYLNSNVASVRTSSTIDSFLYGHWYRIRHRSHFAHFTEGIQEIKDFIGQFAALFDENSTEPIPVLLQELATRFQVVLTEMEDKKITFAKGKLLFKNTIQYDYFFRANIFGRSITQRLLTLYYELEAYLSLAQAMKTHSLVFPVFTNTSQPEIYIERLYHPAVANPVANDVHFDADKRFLFLTGPNMAGKTTFLKAVGLAVYMAHVGLGVSAQAMQLSVHHRLFVNLTNEDNLLRGESFFNNEVKRVVEAAQYIHQGRPCLLIFDEMFKGTNVKDAMDCSQLVIEKISCRRNANAIFSSHFYELALVISCLPAVFLQYFAADLTAAEPRFTYQLKPGVSDVRMGLLLLKQSGIEQLL
jgi:DNA mismatch repair ATPase MutS